MRYLGFFIRRWNSFRARRAFVSALEKRTPLKAGELYFHNRYEVQSFMTGRAYLQDLEVPLLGTYAKKASEVYVEIGCAFGASTIVAMAELPATASLYSIDPYITDSMRPFQATRRRCAGNVRRAMRGIGLLHKLSQWRQVVDYSFNVVKVWDDIIGKKDRKGLRNETIDVLFIDGDHNYEAVKQDFEQWFPHVKKGGYILFHDSRKIPGSNADTFDRGWPGPTQLAQELAQGSDQSLQENRVMLVDEAFSISVFKKQ